MFSWWLSGLLSFLTSGKALWVLTFSICSANQAKGEVLPSGTVPWMAPEFLRDKDIDFAESTEVYSFGILLWEIFHCSNEPYPGLQPVQILFQVSNYGLRPKINESLPQGIVMLIQDCTAEEPSQRPGFK